MNIIKKVAFLAIAVNVSGCASIISGRTQEVHVNTNPAGADCALLREGKVIGRVNPTPGSITIERTKDDITLKCNKEGYMETGYENNSGIAPATWGNLALGGLIGWGVDSAAGADNKYDSPVNLTLLPVLNATPVASPAPAVPATAAPVNPAPLK